VNVHHGAPVGTLIMKVEHVIAISVSKYDALGFCFRTLSSATGTMHVERIVLSLFCLVTAFSFLLIICLFVIYNK